MTRINIVPVEELHDQHLFAEFREIKMIPRSLERSLRAKTKEQVLNTVPNEFCLGKGHVTFFYDKGEYLYQRFVSIKFELSRREINFDLGSVFDPNGVMAPSTDFYGTYTPSNEALSLIRVRIQERVDMKPTWYRKTIY